MTKTEKTYERVAHSPTEAARLLGKSRSFVYEEIAKGRLKAHMLGTRMAILDHDLRGYLASLPVMKPTAA
ncbi:helix-turn-helix domain-containing protein [Microvirga arabica]|uniref:Helix-turn-helix domain-containing protein n=1 Tax=Microvirga arabica TaxID=1128671 RepID=A0ABV6Y5W8_9HYPH